MSFANWRGGLLRKSGASVLWFLLFLGICFISSCRKKPSISAQQSLPTLDQAVASEEAAARELAAAQKVTSVKADAVVTIVDAVEPKEPARKMSSAAKKSVESLRFVGYNLANWLVLDERYDPKTHITAKNAPKPEKEKAAVVAIVAAEKPDVFGVCEIGTEEDLLELQKRLKDAGVDLPHMHYSGGIDPVRHLGLLSRFPIVATATPVDNSYRLEGKEYNIQRGILDATVKTPDGRLWRFLGIHLKSKRDVENGDQNQMRINEAQLLRKHIDEILKADPLARIISYGDFNDTRRASPLKIVQGTYNSPRGMTPIGLHDSRDEYWTHFWEREDIYSRFDYIMFSQALKKEVVYEACGIIDPVNWRMGSDHRAVKAVFR